MNTLPKTARRLYCFLSLAALLLLSVLPATAGINQWTGNGPNGGTIKALAIDPDTPTTVYAGTYRGGLYKSTDGGGSWRRLSTESSQSDIQAIAVDPNNSSIIYAGGPTTILKSTNAGETWSYLYSGLTGHRVATLAIDPYDSHTIYAGTSGGGVFKSNNGGGYWYQSGSGITSNNIRSLVIDPHASSILYACSDEGALFMTADKGVSWRQLTGGLPGNDILSFVVDPRSAGLMYAGAGSGALFKSSDGGYNWSRVDSTLSSAISVLAIDPAEIATLYAGTPLGLLKSSNGGGSWRPVGPGLPAPGINALAVVPTASATLYAGSIYAGVFKTTDAGATWSQVNAGLAATEVNAVVADPFQPAVVYAGTAGGVFKSTDNGGSWFQVSTIPNITAVALDPVTPSTVYAGSAASSASGVYKSLDGGNSWSPAHSGIIEPRKVMALAVDPVTAAIVYAGTENGLFKSTDGAGSWTKVSAGMSNEYVAALAIDPATPTTLYAGTGGGVFRSMNGGATWTPLNSGLTSTRVNALAVDPAAPLTVYAGTYDGGVFKRMSSEGYWNPINTGLEVPLPGMSILARNIKSLAIDRSAPATVYAGTANAGVFKSANGGTGWRLLPTGLASVDVPSLAIDPGNPAHLYAGTVGGVWGWTTAPVAAMSPTLIDFGPINNGLTSSPFPVTIANEGLATLVVTSFAKSGTEAGMFQIDYGNGTGGSCGATPSIAPGASCRVSVSFTPGSGAAKSALLELHASGQNGAAASVALQGAGGDNISNASPAGGSYAVPQSVSISSIRPATIYYTTDGTDPVSSPNRQIYSGAFTLSVTTAVRFYGVDGSGYAEPVQSAIYAFPGGSGPDVTPPASTATPPAGAYASSQSVALACSDQSGGCATWFCFGNGCTPTTPYHNAISIAAPTVVRFYSSDFSGNSEAVRTAVYSFDSTPPATTPDRSSGSYAPMSVYLSCNDGSGSGCAAVYSCLGTGCTPAPSGPLVTVTSSSVLRFYSVDYAGNSEEMKSVSYSIDADPPAASASPSGGIYNAPQRLAFSCNDASGSGCDTVYYCLGRFCTPTTPYTVPIDLATSAYVTFYARDRAGNEEDARTVRYTVLGAAPATIRVPADKATIQAAIDAGNDGDTVLVSPGTYLENIDFKGKVITVTSSGGPQDTIIDGNNAGPVVSFGSGEWNSSVLNGFTIRKGREGGAYSPSGGGGISVIGSSPTISNNRITDNTACEGAGIYLYGASPIVRNNVISGNRTSGCTGGGGGGIAIWWGTFAEIIDNEISYNDAGPDDGGGIALTGAGSPVIRGNVIKNNKTRSEGGGIHLYGGALIAQNLIALNYAHYNGGGVALAASESAVLLNNTIVDNSASRGSGVFADSSYGDQASLFNNLIVAQPEQSAVYCDSLPGRPSTRLKNNIAFSPSGPSYGGLCYEEDGINGNLSADPKLYSSAPGYYYLTPGSPVIDAGDSTAATLPQNDLYGHVRLVDGDNDGEARVDIGAAEYDPTRPLAMVFGAPAAIVNKTTATLDIGGELVSFYRYSLDGAPFGTTGIPAATPIVLTGLADGQHTLRILGVSSAQREQLIPYATTVTWLVDATPPGTAATPAAGVYSSAQQVTLTCNDGTGTGCDATYYCLGSGCTPSQPYGGGTIGITGTTDLRFYSTDQAGHSEAVVTASYIGAPQVAVSPTSSNFGPVPVTLASIRFFTIANSGTAPLLLSTPITITGPDSSSFKVATGGLHPCDSLTPTIPTGQSCTVAVTFLTSLGAKYANLRIVSNSLLKPLLDVPLQGTGVPSASLITTITGSGSINSLESGYAGLWSIYFNCDEPRCQAPFPAGTMLLLWATPSSLYRFDGWSGGGCSGTGYCDVTLDADTVIAATFTPIPLVQRSDTLDTFLSLQEAYAAVANGHSLKARNETLPGNFYLNRNVTVTLQGGFNGDFATVSGKTVLKGVLKLRSGRLNVKNVMVR